MELGRPARRFPTDYRAVTAGWSGMLVVDYWSAPREFVDGWARGKTSDERADLRENQPRHCRADNQDPEGRPAEIDRAAWPGFRGDLPADRIAAWLPLDHSVNVGLVDGRRNYHLTRTIQDDAGTRRVRLHVLSGEFDVFPEFVKDQWPLLNWNRSSMTPAPPGPDTPAGMVVVRVHQPAPSEYRCEFTLDPARDFIAVRQVEWSNNRKRWYQEHTRATRLARLPGGSWYVAEWERRAGYQGTPDAPGDPAALHADARRVVVTPLRPDEFPPGIFDGDKFVEAARKAGATIETDR